jgi:uncharacterized protein YjbI with pentapeptide repeats
MNAGTLSKEYANGNRNFQGFQLSGVNLGWSNLVDSNFSNADLSRANLSGASLKSANLSGNTNLAFSDLSRADLTGADLRGANLEGANLQGTLLNNTIYDKKTRFPKGFNLDTTEAINIDLKEQYSSKQKTDFIESLTFSRDTIHRENTELAKQKEAKAPRKNNLDSKKLNHTLNLQKTQAIDKINKDYHTDKPAFFLLKVLFFTIITIFLGSFFLGGVFLSLSDVFKSQQKIIKQEQDKVKKAETQNNQLVREKEEIEAERNKVKRALETEQFKDQHDELSSSNLPEQSISPETENVSGNQTVYEVSSSSLAEQSVSPETEPASGTRTVYEASSSSLPEQTISPETEPASGTQAIILIQTLYQSLTNQNWSKAINLYEPSLEYQFSPDFVQQFDQVTVENLKITSQSNSEIRLIGQTSYLYPDGTIQQEARSFIVAWNAGTPLITDSAFIRVIKMRSSIF